MKQQLFMKLIITTCTLIITGLLSPLVYGSSFAADFNNAITSPRATSLGMAYTGIANDSSAIIMNPGGLSFYKGGVNVMSYQGFETTFISLDLSHKIGNLSLGIAYLGASSDEILETEYNNDSGRYEATGTHFKYSGNALITAVAYPVYYDPVENVILSLGTSLRVLKETLHTSSATGISNDIGLLFNWQHISVGVNAKNKGLGFIKWNSPGAPKHVLDEELSAGASIKLFEDLLTLTADVKKPSNGALTFHGGTEIILGRFIAFRAGYNNGRLNFGTGLMLGGIRVDYSLTTPNPGFEEVYENIHKISFGYTFNAKLKAPSKKTLKKSEKFTLNKELQNIINEEKNIPTKSTIKPNLDKKLKKKHVGKDKLMGSDLFDDIKGERDW